MSDGIVFDIKEFAVFDGPGIRTTSVSYTHLDVYKRQNLIMAASAIVVLPCVVVFLLGQKHIIGGIAISGIKG